jgi:glucose/arabinose dehydrogenase
MPTAAAIIAGFALSLALASVAAPPALTPQPFVSGLAAPVEVAHANDGSGRLFVLEQAGRVWVIRNGALLATPFLDLSAAAGGPVRTGGEQGLLGIAFHPHYATNGRFFVYYTRPRAGDPDGNEIVLARYTRSAGNADVADPASAAILLTIAHPQFGNHNGGKLAFGPHDGYLYAGVGDGGGAGDPFEVAQSLADLRGKVLRLDVDGSGGYRVPPSNPLAAAGAPNRAEIWAYGLRNPWKLSFDRATGDLYIGDVGQGAREEIDFQARWPGGLANYGWDTFEGTRCHEPTSGCSLADHVPPILEYAHDSSGGFSVTGGYRYRGTALSALQGHYVYGDYVSGRIWAAAPDVSGTWATTQVGTLAALSTFGEDEFGELYAANRDAGTLVRLTPAASPAPTGNAILRYRLYNPFTRDHLYTTDANEYATLPQCCGWQPEGAIYRLLQGPGTRGGVAAIPLYRLYQPTSQLHHWTPDRNEYDTLPAFGYVQEGVDGYVFPSPASGTVPLYRLYHPAGLHLWTTDVNERHTLQHQFGWIDEGISGYVLPI